ncbi:MAG: DinB family protein, partial [Bacteroidota bacterium]
MLINYDSTAALLEALHNSKKETLAYFDLPEGELDKSYAPGKWNVRQLLHHLADAETVLYDRLRRGIARPGQIVWGFDQDAWANGLNYDNRPLTLNKKVYDAVRDSVIDLAKAWYEKAGDNFYIHSETGSRVLRQEFDKVAWHNE